MFFSKLGGTGNIFGWFQKNPGNAAPHQDLTAPEVRVGVFNVCRLSSR